MKFKKLVSLTLVGIMGVMSIGCSSTDESAEANAESQENAPVSGEVLTIGIMSSISSLPIIIADQNGYFEEEGLNVDVQIFKAAQDRDAALQANALDGVLADEVAIAIYQNAGIDMQITGNTEGSFTIVTSPNSEMTTIQDLVGKKVAISENTSIAYSLDYMLEQNGLAASDVVTVAIPPMPARLEALKAGEVDAAVMPSPFSDDAINAGGKVLAVIDDTNRFISITGFLQETLDTRMGDVQAYYRALDKATTYINMSQVSEMEDTIINVCGYPESMRGNIILPTFQPYHIPSEEEVNDVFDWSREKGILTTDITATDVLTDVTAQ